MSDKTLLPAVEINPTDVPNATVIWLHGLGADGHDFEPVVEVLSLGELGVRFVLPHAPRLPVTINGGHVMPAWYDIYSAEFARREDEAGTRASARAIAALIEREVLAGIPAARIVLAGFSQGGAIALHAALRFPHRLAGVMALSTYLPLADTLAAEAASANAALPIFMAHGTHDPVIPLALAEMSRERLRLAGYKVEWHDYPMPHTVAMDEIGDIRRWLLGVLGLG